MILGYIGAFLLLVSYTQSKMQRMLLLQACACMLLLAYSMVIGAWPFVIAQGGCLVLILSSLIRGASERDETPHE